MRIKRISKILSAALSAAMLVTSIPASVLAEPAEAAQEEAQGNPLRLWYDEPASAKAGNYGQGTWQERTLPIGNGDMGANIYGEIVQEHLTFNEKTLWTGGPSSSRPNYIGGNLENVGNHGALVKQIQALFAEGKDSEASALCDTLIGGQAGYGAYQAWGDIYFDYQGISADNAQNYVRDLDLKTAVSTVNFQEGDTNYTREYFISNPDNVLVAKLSADGAEKLNLNVRFTSKQGATAVASGDSLVVAGAVSDNQLKFDSVLKVVNDGGTLTANGAQLEVRNADSVVVYLSAATDYKNEYPVYRTGETADELHARVLKTVEDAANKGYDTVKTGHIEDYGELFSRMELDLGGTVSEKATDDLLSAYNGGTATEAERRQLEVMLFQYGRYLTLGSSRENSQLPSNLQGVWNDSNSPSWASDYHMNVNLQMNYWPTYVTNLAECADPLIRYVDSLREPGRVTASIYAGIDSTDENPENGFMAHTQNTPFGWTCPGWAFSWGWSPAAVPWILQNCWDYYDFTRDEDYLEKNIYPMMKEEAVLYDQMLIEDEDGKLVSSPSYSPEHGPYTSGNTYEQVLIWQLYEDVVTAAEIVGDTEKIETWKSNQANLKGPIEIGDDGQIKEWYSETTINSAPGTQGYGHRHLSHMLGLFPGDLVSVETPEWLEAARISMNGRTDESTGWGMGQRINTWARLADGNRAYKLITDLFKGGIYQNLWDTHTPYQIDGNFGYTSGVAEMLIQSNVGYINLLPALPDVWTEGSAKGLVARGNFEVDMDWSDGSVDNVIITSNKGGEAIVQCEDILLATVIDENGKLVEVTPVKNNRISFNTEEGKSYQIFDFPKKEKVPSNLCITSTENNRVTLSWDAVESEGVKYNVYRQTEDGSRVLIASNITGTTYTDTEAYGILGTLLYQVSAGSGSFESDLSQSVKRVIGTEMIDDQDSQIKYEGAWGNYSDATNYNGTIKFLQSPTGGETATLTFDGTGVEVISVLNSDRGKLEITIDNVSYGEFDTYASATQKQYLLFSKKDLEFGTHTIVVKATNTKSDSSSGTKVELDAFRVFHTEEPEMPQLPEDSQSQVLAVESNRVMAQWKEIENADSYKIYKDDELVNTVENPYAWIEGLEAGKSYNIIIKAVVNEEETELAVFTVSTAAEPEKPGDVEIPETVEDVTIVRDAADSSNLHISWDKFEGAEEYLIYIGTEKKASVSDAAITLSGMDKNQTYHVKIIAIDKNNMILATSIIAVDSNTPVAGITVTESKKELKAGETYSIQAEMKIDGVANKDLTYISSDSQVASVDNSGKVTAVAVGDADITITSKLYPAIMAVVQITVTKNSGTEDKPSTNGSTTQDPSEQKPPTGDGAGATPVPALNTVWNDGTFQYKVTKSDAANGTVMVMGLTAAGKKKTTITILDTITKDGYTFKVTEINKNAFQKNKKLKSVVIGSNVTNIGATSFKKCTKLKSIQFKSTNAPKIGKNAFKGIKANCKIYYPKKMKAKALKTLKKRMKSAGKKITYKKK